MTEITSASNPKFKAFKGLLSKKERNEHGEYIVEGKKCVLDAIASGKSVSAVIICDELIFDLPHTDAAVYTMPKFLTDKLSDTKTPQGIFAVLKAEKAVFLPKKGGAYVYCDNISDPGNLGTIIRTCDSAGFDGVLLSPGCTDAYSPKTVRSCMGSFFHTDIFENVIPEQLSGFKVYAGILRGDSADYREPEYSGSIIIAVGNEANGVGEEIKNLCHPVKIPIYGSAESLNAAVAAALLMYEASNKRHLFL